MTESQNESRIYRFKKITLLGCGQMGSKMAVRMSDSGNIVTVIDKMANSPFTVPSYVFVCPFLAWMLFFLEGYNVHSLRLETTSFSNVPSPSISRRRWSPGWMCEIPSGVPDQIISPGLRVI